MRLPLFSEELGRSASSLALAYLYADSAHGCAYRTLIPGATCKASAVGGWAGMGALGCVAQAKAQVSVNEQPARIAGGTR